jgi:cobalt/nickel transport system permease protein
LQHHFIDVESHIESPIRRLNPKAKIVTLTLMVFIIVTTPPAEIASFFLYLTIALVMVIVSHIPLTFFLKRLVLVLPFIAVAVVAAPIIKGETVVLTIPVGFMTIDVSHEGALILFNVTAKSILSVLFLSFLVSTTPFSDVIVGLRELRFPHILSDALSFMYQYIFILIDEVEKISRARDARLYGGRWIWHSNIIGYMIGAIFVRSMERGERTYLAMKARGYDTSLITRGTGKMGTADYFFIVSVLLTTVVIRIFGALGGLAV